MFVTQNPLLLLVKLSSYGEAKCTPECPRDRGNPSRIIKVLPVDCGQGSDRSLHKDMPRPRWGSLQEPHMGSSSFIGKMMEHVLFSYIFMHFSYICMGNMMTKDGKWWAFGVPQLARQNQEYPSLECWEIWQYQKAPPTFARMGAWPMLYLQ